MDVALFRREFVLSPILRCRAAPSPRWSATALAESFSVCINGTSGTGVGEVYVLQGVGEIYNLSSLAESAEQV